MKRIYLVLSLGLLVLTTACGGLLGKKEKTNKQSVANSVKNSIAKATEALELTKNYYAIDEDQPVIIGEIKDGELGFVPLARLSHSGGRSARCAKGLYHRRHRAGFQSYSLCLDRSG